MNFNMQIVKIIMLFIVFGLSSLLGILVSRKYTYRLQELEEMKTALNIFKSKVKFTYAPIPEIFEEIASNTSKNISNIFRNAEKYMNNELAGKSWEIAVENSEGYLNNEDKHNIKSLSKLLGETDIEGQISQIELTENFLEKQIKEAIEKKSKNEKLYKKLGATIGLVVVIILI